MSHEVTDNYGTNGKRRIVRHYTRKAGSPYSHLAYYTLRIDGVIMHTIQVDQSGDKWLDDWLTGNGELQP